MRSQFLLNPTVTFLNHGSFGACPKSVLMEYQRWQNHIEQQPVAFFKREYPALMQAARQALAEYVHVGANDLAYFPNATTGVNVIARSLALQPGDEILASNHEYGAIERAFKFVAEKANAVYREHVIATPYINEADFIESFWSAVHENTRVILLSHITSPTAFIFPVQEICRRAREAGILTMIDGAHAIGQIPLDLSALGVDFYVSNNHKWLCSPKGSAFLYVRPDVQDLIEPLIVSWGWNSPEPGPSRFIDEQEWQGTSDPSAYLATPNAIQFQKQYHWDTIRKSCHDLAIAARNQLITITKTEKLCSEENFAQMFAVELPSIDVIKAQERLYTDFRVEAPIYKWNNKSLLRVSIQAYNTEADIDQLLHAMRSILL